MHRPTRRRLLQALGLAGGAMALPLRGRGAQAPAEPLRVIFVVTSHGTVHESWSMRRGNPDDVDYELDLNQVPGPELSEILRPLWAHRDELVVIDGVGNACAMTAGFLAHPAGNASCQTGWVPVEVPGSYARTDGASLDQVVAATRGTPFPSLEWAIGGAPISYNELGQALPFETDPVGAWERLFPTAATPERPEESAAIRSRQGSVLDLAVGRYDSIIARLPAEERAGIELHRDLVRDLESRIAALDALQCLAPPRPDGEALPAPEEAEHPAAYFDVYADMAVAALACGMTEVITLRLDAVPTATIGAPPGDLHNDIAHSVDNSLEAREWMTRHHAYLATLVADLVDRLAEAPDRDGQRLLDRTLVVWHNEMSTGDHLFHTVPVVIAGGSSALRSGRYFRYAPRHPVSSRFGTEIIGRPHNQLLTTLGVALGLEIDHFGVTELTRADGSPLDCTGTLPGVLR